MTQKNIYADNSAAGLNLHSSSMAHSLYVLIHQQAKLIFMQVLLCMALRRIAGFNLAHMNSSYNSHGSHFFE